LGHRTPLETFLRRGTDKEKKRFQLSAWTIGQNWDKKENKGQDVVAGPLAQLGMGAYSPTNREQ
jgi:hypothetical protein